MSSHLGHKLPWDLLVECVSPHKDQGVSFPIGTCNQIHITNRKVELRVKNCKYIQENDICRDSSCDTKPEEKIFYKSTKKMKPFARKSGGRKSDEDVEEKFKKFTSYFERAIMEFARTELETPAKDLQYEVDDSGFVSCETCNRFITLLEFGDKKELFKYSDEEIKDAIYCRHTQAIGETLRYLMYQVFTFYLVMNIILRANLKEEDWPSGMKPGSRFRDELLYPHDGQTFLPHSRKYLSEAMLDLEKTKILNKNLFKFMYFYVMINLKIDENYSFVEDFSPSSYDVRRIG